MRERQMRTAIEVAMEEGERAFAAYRPKGYTPPLPAHYLSPGSDPNQCTPELIGHATAMSTPNGKYHPQSVPGHADFNAKDASYHQNELTPHWPKNGMVTPELQCARLDDPTGNNLNQLTPESMNGDGLVLGAGSQATATASDFPPYVEIPIQQVHVSLGREVFCPHSEIPSSDHTCYHPFHSGYSETDLPLVLFRLDAPDHDDNLPEIAPLTENGQVVRDRDGRPIRDFPFLPRYISSRPPGWLLEYWMRTESRLTYRDIKSRMVGETGIPTDNVLNMRREREARQPLGLSCWTTRRGDITKAEVERAERLTADQVAFNTTMTVIYETTPDGNTKLPSFLRSKSLKSTVARNFPLQTFINGENRLHTPSPRLVAAIDLLYRLQDAAVAAGTENWRQLPASMLPRWWARHSAGSATYDSVIDFGEPAPIVQNIAPNFTSSGVPNARSAIIPGTQSIMKGAQNIISGTHNIIQAAHYVGPGAQHVVPPVQNFVPRTQNMIESTSVYPDPNPTPTLTDTIADIGGLLNPADAYPTPLDSRINSPIVMAAPLSINIASAALLQLECNEQHNSSRDQITDISDDRERKPGGVPIDPRLLDFDPMDVDGGAGHSSKTYHNDPALQDLYRFNGSGAFSVNKNSDHRLNTVPNSIMERNNPFEPLRQQSISLQRSFERYLLDDLDGN